MSQEEQLKKLEDVVIYSTSTTELNDARITLTKMASSLYVAVSKTDFPDEKIELKGQLTLVNTLIQIGNERYPDVANAENTANYKFRMAAKSMLSLKTYKSIYQVARDKSMQEIRQMGVDNEPLNE